MTDQRDPGDAGDLPVLSVTRLNGAHPDAVTEASDLPVLRDERGHLLPGTASLGASRKGRRNKRTLAREQLEREVLLSSLLPSLRGVKRRVRGLPQRKGYPPPPEWLVHAAQRDVINLLRDELVAGQQGDATWVEHATDEELEVLHAIKERCKARRGDYFAADSIPPPALPAPAAQEADELIIDVPSREAPE